MELRTDASREAVEAADQREWRAAARSLRPLLHPASVAVVGVRRSAGGFGHGVLDAIRSSAYAGAVHVVHPEADVIDGLPTVRSLADVDGPVDLVVVAVPADGVADVLRDAAANGAGAAVVISSGFSGNGSDERRHELLTLARAHSLRLVGPNSQGVLANGAGLNATLLHDVPEVGGLAVASQSGGWASRCSTSPATSASGCRPSSPSATRSTCRATTSSRPGWTTSRSRQARSTSSRSATH